MNLRGAPGTKVDPLAWSTNRVKMKNRVMLSNMNRLLLDDLLFYIIYVWGIIDKSKKKIRN
jgi:hypothetical protein